ncbi:MAG TPA: hypothetical protein VFI29_08730 [Hanamia sp.]|nr:hypothetical protein [Hanamia sp.]
MCCLLSCTTRRYVYSASPANSPYFNKKGESELAGYFSSSAPNLPRGYANGFDLHGAYAISDHWALTTGYFNRKEKDIGMYNSNMPFDSSVIRYKRKLFGVGAGYFIAVNPKKTITFNMYGGMDFGKFSFTENGWENGIPGDRFHNSNITKWFIQPSINFMPGRYFHASIILKNSFVHYGGITTSYTTDELDYYSLNKIANKTIYFIEPAWDIQLGLPEIPWLKVDMMWSFVSTHIFDNTLLDVRGLNFSIGLSTDLSQIRKK